jgi:hypothetical protein
VRAVREEMAEYVITLQGKLVAVLRPFTDDDAQRLRQPEIERTLEEMKALAQQVRGSLEVTRKRCGAS